MKINIDTFSAFRKGKFLIFLLLAVIGCILPLQGADLEDYPWPDPEAVIRLDLQKVCRILQTKEPGAVSMEQFLTLLGPAGNVPEMEKYFQEILISVISLRKEHCMIFCRTSLQETQFRALLQKMGKGVRVTARSCGKSLLYQITGGGLEGRKLFAAFLPGSVVLFCDRDPSWYLQSSAPKGLTKLQRSRLKKAYPLSGYVQPNKRLYRKNPFLPRFERILFHVLIQRDSSLICLMEGPLVPGENAEMKMQQLQQTRMMAAILLNNVDPSMSEEFMQNGQVYRRDNTLFVHQYFSASFLQKFFRQGFSALLGGKNDPVSSPAGTVKRKVDRP